MTARFLFFAEAGPTPSPGRGWNNITFAPSNNNHVPYGNVVVENGGELRINANETTLTKDVEVKLGGTLIIVNQ